MLHESALSRRFEEGVVHGIFAPEQLQTRSGGRAIMENLQATSVRTPAHLWVVGVLSLLWNSFGCYDYTMTKLDPVKYMTSVGMGEAEIAYMDTFPAWLSAFWAIGVWGSLLGSVLLLIRSRHAVTAFAASLLGLAVSQVYQFADGAMPASMYSPVMLVMTVVIWASLLFFLWYARRMAAAGVLR